MHYEIQAMLSKVQANEHDRRFSSDQDRPLIKAEPVYDNESAVNYVVYDNNQWVSYDDAKTFKQKTQWADEIGVGGSLIWASDTDNDKYSAMSGLVGKKVYHPNILKEVFEDTQATNAQNLIGENGQDCKRMKDCVDPDIVRCPDGQRKLGWDKDGCNVCTISKGQFQYSC